MGAISNFIKEGNDLVALKVDVSESEPLEKALKRLKKKIEREGILKILKQRKHYEKPSEKKRRKLRSAKAKAKMPPRSRRP
ncbi:MAG: 30S ribosomal protein S21 [Omnitrophica bacterium GWA2_52_8]|nr:MAG: 30S ribosomal protein S21 [Omnitrophica bacterium GWA2_52_8]